MHELLRRRTVVVAILIAIVAAGAGRRAAVRAQDKTASPPLTVHITSPLGRLGTSGTVRIVAQIHTADGKPVPTVRFYVDDKLIKTHESGPPYAEDWVDDNQLEQRQIRVEAVDAAGNTARDEIVLNAFEVAEATQVSSVLVETSVYTDKGHYVSGLGINDFSLTENGTAEPLTLVSPESVPATFALLIDSSQSMATRVEFVRLAARRIGKFMHPKDHVIVAPFSTALQTVTGPTDDQRTMQEAIGAIHPSGGTAILDALSALTARMVSLEGRRAIVLLTDGFDENSTRNADDVIKEANAAQVTVYVVGIGGISGVSLKGQTLLRRVAAETGGKAFFPWGERDLETAYDLVATDAQNRYLLAYTPSNEKADGTWRAINVKARPGDVVVQTRAGYFAPKPPPIRPELEFTFTDSAQQYVDVNPEDLVVIEDGVEQKIDSFHEAVAPVSVVLALDASGSMRKSAEEVVSAAKGFVKALRPQDALGVMMFSDQATFVRDLSTSRSESLEAIDKYKADGGTALYDALDGALFRLKSVTGRRAIVVVTDGRDENNPGTGPGSGHTLAEELDKLKKSGAVTFGVGIGSKVDRETLESIARLSGGLALFPSDVSELGAEYDRIVENLRRRFVVSYASTNTERDGGWRKVEIRIRSSNVVLTSAGGYFAPER